MNFYQSAFKTRLKKLSIVLLALLTLFSFLPNRVYAASGSIYTVATNAGNPPFSYPAYGGAQREVARDSSGNLYSVYISLGAGAKLNIYLAKSTDEGQNWTSQAVTTDADYDQNSPSIAIDSHDNIHVVWYGFTTGSPDNYQIRYREYTNGAWQPIVELTTAVDYNSEFSPAIAIDSHDNIHVVWDGYSVASPGNGQVRYREYTNGAWQPIVELTTDADYSQWASSIAIDSQNNIHVVWSGFTIGSPANSQIRYREYTNGSWQPIVELTTNVDNRQAASSIAIDSQNNIHVAWIEYSVSSPGNGQVRYREYTNGAWQSIVELTTDTDYDQNSPSIAIDSQDNIHVVWDGLTPASPNNYQIRYREYTNGAWQPVENLTSSENNQEFPNLIWAEWPKICDVSTNVTKTGFFATWSEIIGGLEDPTSFSVKDYVSSDLTWQTGCPGPTPTPIATPTPNINVLPQTGANF